MQVLYNYLGLYFSAVAKQWRHFLKADERLLNHPMKLPAKLTEQLRLALHIDEKSDHLFQVKHHYSRCNSYNVHYCII